MKFIDKIIALSESENNIGFRSLIDYMGQKSRVFSTKFKGFGSCRPDQELYFFYSDGESAFMLIDEPGNSDELADEECFCSKIPLWFTESNHRISPFSRIRTLALGFKEMMSGYGANVTDRVLCILVTSTNIINSEDYIVELKSLDGAVFHNMNNFSGTIQVSSNNKKGQEIFNFFLARWETVEKVFSLFCPYMKSEDDNNKKDKLSLPASFDVFDQTTDMEFDDFSGPEDPNLDVMEKKPKCHKVEKTDQNDTYDIFPERNVKDVGSSSSNYFKSKRIDELINLDDTDFTIFDEAVNTETGETVTVKKVADLPPVDILEPLVDPQTFLDGMIGLKELKETLLETVAYAHYTNKVKATFPALSLPPLNLHALIIGNPGTGKTTMCRIYGGLLHKAGVLSRGHTVVASRGSFLGTNFGTEEQRMRQCLKLARGGCLFIDEAGLLFNNPHPHDPGKNALQLLLQLLADESNRDIAVVLALYANDNSLERLYAVNPGFKSRFVNILSFRDYTWSELLDIARMKMKIHGLSATRGAWHRFCDVLKESYDHRDRNYGNAREVVNLLQKCVVRHAVRCETQRVTDSNLLRLTVSDIPSSNPVVLKNRIGFRQ